MHLPNLFLSKSTEKKLLLKRILKSQNEINGQQRDRSSEWLKQSLRQCVCEGERDTTRKMYKIARTHTVEFYWNASVCVPHMCSTTFCHSESCCSSHDSNCMDSSPILLRPVRTKMPEHTIQVKIQLACRMVGTTLLMFDLVQLRIGRRFVVWVVCVYAHFIWRYDERWWTQCGSACAGTKKKKKESTEKT